MSQVGTWQQSFPRHMLLRGGVVICWVWIFEIWQPPSIGCEGSSGRLKLRAIRGHCRRPASAANVKHTIRHARCPPCSSVLVPSTKPSTVAAGCGPHSLCWLWASLAVLHASSPHIPTLLSRLLFDGGPSCELWTCNATKLGVPVADIEAVMLSHW